MCRNIAEHVSKNLGDDGKFKLISNLLLVCKHPEAVESSRLLTSCSFWTFASVNPVGLLADINAAIAFAGIAYFQLSSDSVIGDQLTTPRGLFLHLGFAYLLLTTNFSIKLQNNCTIGSYKILMVTVSDSNTDSRVLLSDLEASWGGVVFHLCYTCTFWRFRKHFLFQ